MGKWLIGAGVLLILAGLIVLLLQRFGIQLGKLPGDIVYKKGNTVIYVPIVTSLLLSLLLTLLLWFFKK